MAYEIGTATNFKNLFDKAVAFLTTNATLVAAGQAWEVLRRYTDNIDTFTTSFVSTNTDAARNPQHTFRYDARSINYETFNGASAYYQDTSGGAGNSGRHLTFKLRVAKAVDRIWIRHFYGTSGWGPKTFTIEWSDDGSAWTQFASINDTAAIPVSGEERTFTGLNSAGAHLWYRIKVNDVWSGTKYCMWANMLLLNGTEPINHFGDEVILKAKGNSGSDAIFMGIRSEYDSAAGWYNWMLNGYTGYDPSIQSWFKQPGAITLPESGTQFICPMSTFWDSTMPYWFVANGRSFRWVVKVSTSYMPGYMGWLLPYSTPSQYPYPLCVAGNLAPLTSARATNWRYSLVSAMMGTPVGPSATSYASSGTQTSNGSMYCRDPAGAWQNFGQRPGYGQSTIQSEGLQIFAYTNTGLNDANTVSSLVRGVWPHCWYGNTIRDGISGSQLLMPCVLIEGYSTRQLVYGELDGYYFTSGTSNAAENTAVVGGKNHVVFSGCYRTAQGEYFTLCLDT